MTFIEDPNSDARSKMNRAPCICNGQATGIPCEHYWSVIQKFHAANAEALRSGEKQRACTLTAGLVLEFTEEEKPTFCSRYSPRETTGLVGIVRRSTRSLVGLKAKAGSGYESYNKAFEEFRPMTVEEIAELQKEFPDRPTGWSQGKNPMSMSAHDIATGVQIGILKPGEKLPTSDLSEETEKGLDGIFGAAGGIFNKKNDE